MLIRPAIARPQVVAVGIVFMLALAAPALALETSTATDDFQSAQRHVESTDCDALTFDADSNLVIADEPTVPASVLDATDLIKAAIQQAFEAVESARGSACLDVQFDGETLRVSGHIEVCGPVSDTHDGNPGSLVVGGAAIVIGTNASIAEATLVAEVGGGEACFHVTLTDDDVVLLNAVAVACLTVTQRAPGILELPDEDVTWTLAPDELHDPDGTLVLGTPVETGLQVDAFWERPSGATRSEIRVMELEGCAEAPAPTAPPLIPDTAMPAARP